MGRNFSNPPGSEVAVDGTGRSIGIVCARWNDVITGRLLQGATDTLAVRGVAESDVDVAWVPGAFELPLAAQVMARTGRYDAVIAIGCVIRGDTAHFEYVAGPAAEGIMDAQLRTEVPIVLAVLTVEDRRQALVRSVLGGDVRGDNKGAEAADTALEMAHVLAELRAG
ncbi:MAG TPA: 6,7-dimethyl-8-ribityllumazine synthase [Microthrixaceae bacterium]|jgi:6,7-dimethyl-8-ribityllumazine synthase|nr:6,7-dimethyl-8-ribityllumazine synthase [Microthrixaceae bacterium]